MVTLQHQPIPTTTIKLGRPNFSLTFFSPPPPPFPSLTTTHLTFRFNQHGSFQVRQRLAPVIASKTEGSDVGNKSSSKAQGPPFLTILAGFFVLFVVVWVVKSIVLWLVGLIINPPAK